VDAVQEISRVVSHCRGDTTTLFELSICSWIVCAKAELDSISANAMGKL